jgi:hypothetical protein
VASKGERRENRFYIVIAVLIIFLIFFTILFSGKELTVAYISHEFLDDANWYDSGDRESGSNFLGLEKWTSFTYKVDDDFYNASLSITSFKTLFMMSEDDLISEISNTIIESAEELNIILDKNSKISGSRVVNLEHKTMYIIYNGYLINNEVTDKVIIIGETWNCAVSGTSIVCIGYAQITNNSSEEKIIHWTKLVKDQEGTFGLGEYLGEDGLIFNVKCH